MFHSLLTCVQRVICAPMTCREHYNMSLKTLMLLYSACEIAIVNTCARPILVYSLLVIFCTFSDSLYVLTLQTFFPSVKLVSIYLKFPVSLFSSLL